MRVCFTFVNSSCVIYLKYNYSIHSFACQCKQPNAIVPFFAFGIPFCIFSAATEICACVQEHMSLFLTLYALKPMKVERV